MKTKNILIYDSIWDTLEDLTPEQTHELFTNINLWRTEQPVQIKDQLVKVLYKQMLPLLEKQAENYDKKVENGSKGGRPKKAKETDNNHKVFPANQVEPTQTQPNHREIEIDKEREKEIESEIEPTSISTQFNTLMSYFDPDPNWVAYNIGLWNKLPEYDKEMALEKAEEFLKAYPNQKGLSFYLRDEKWNWDLTISTKTDKIKETNWII